MGNSMCVFKLGIVCGESFQADTAHYNFFVVVVVVVFCLIGWAAELGCDSFPDFVSFFSLCFFGPSLTAMSCQWLPSSHYFSSCYCRNLGDSV